MKALIAGGGIAGLATGIALREAGADVQVLERSPRLREIGAGLMIWPNGARSLEALGVKVNALSVRRLTIRNWHGRVLSDYPLDAIAGRYGYDASFIHRADLQAALASRLGGDRLRLGSEVERFAQDERGVTVTLRDGTRAEGDLLIGADGLRSAVRRHLLDDGEPTYLGSTVWRGVVGGDGLPIPSQMGINWIGRGAEFLAFRLPDDQIYWAGVTKAPRGERAGPGGHKPDLLAAFGDWERPVPELIEATEEAASLRNDMYDRRPASRWSSGRVALAGDAAHPMTPNASQGACQALEDAVAIGASLRERVDVAAAFAAYERTRLRRANGVVAMARQSTRAVQLDNPVLCALRDLVAYRVAERLFLSQLDRILGPRP